MPLQGLSYCIQLLASRLPVRLGKEGAQGCGDHDLIPLRNPGKRVAHEVDATPLPGSTGQDRLHYLF